MKTYSQHSSFRKVKRLSVIIGLAALATFAQQTIADTTITITGIGHKSTKTISGNEECVAGQAVAVTLTIQGGDKDNRIVGSAFCGRHRVVGPISADDPGNNTPSSITVGGVQVEGETRCFKDYTPAIEGKDATPSTWVVTCTFLSGT